MKPRLRLAAISIVVVLLAVFPTASSHAAIQFAALNSSAFSGAQVVTFNSFNVPVQSQLPTGLAVFVSNAYFNTVGISGLFTGNTSAPITPPAAIELGPTPGPFDYFHFYALPGYEISAIGISATGAFTGQSTTFRTFAANTAAESIQFDSVMTPTGGGVGGLNGGAVFLGVSSQPAPITAFRVWQLDDGYGILDNLVVDIHPTPAPPASEVPEASSLAVWALLGLTAGGTAWRNRKKSVGKA